ncbi:MAG: T9SS type A sorting domain-containing protein [Bacteroidota bacterium]
MNPIKIYLPLFFLLFVLPLSLSAQNFQWIRGAGGPGDEKATAVIDDSEGNVYIAGYFSGSIDIDPGSGVFMLSGDGTSVNEQVFDAFLLKLDANGNFVWAKSFGAIEDQIQSGHNACDLTIDANDNIYMSGGFKFETDMDPGPNTLIKTPTGSYDAFISKFDPDGNLVWNQTFGSSGSDFNENLVVTADGSIVATGYFSGTIDVDASANSTTLTSNGLTDVFVLKLDANGNLIWAKSFGNVNFSGVYGLTTDLSDNVLLTGFFKGTLDFDPGTEVNDLSAIGFGDTYILKLNSQGEFVWARSMGMEESNAYGHKIITDDTGNIYTIGDYTYGLDADPGPGISNLDYHNSFNFYLIQLTSDGDFGAATSWGGEDLGIYEIQLALNPDNNILISGSYEGHMNFAGLAFYNGGDDSGNVFLFELTSELDTLQTRELGSEEMEFSRAMYLSPLGYLYFAGYFSGSSTFDPSNSTPVSSHGYSDMFVAKYSLHTLNLNENYTTSAFILSPNPTHGKILIQPDMLQTSVEVKLFSALGQEITATTYVNTSQIEYEIPGENGVYFLSITSGTGSSTFKVIKE